MATTVNVTVLATDQNNNAVASARVTCKLSHADVDSTYGYILPEEKEGTTDASGEVVFALWPNELGSAESYYVFKIENPDTGKIQRINATIPNTDCNLHAVADLPTYDGATVVTAPLNANLASIASLTTAADKVLYFSDENTAALADFTAAGRALVDDANAAAQRTTLELGNVDNTSDADKPISTATQAALDDKQPLDAELTAIAGLTSAADRVPYFTGLGAAALAVFTSAARTFTAAVDAAAQRVAIGLGNVDNTSDADKPVSTAQAAADAAVLSSAQSYADGLVVGLIDDRGNYDASVNTFPASGGSGSAGAIKKGDLWTISVAGTLGGHAVTAGDVIRALVDTPGQTDSNWAITENNFGYVAENSANKDASGGYAGLTLFKINFRNALNTITSFFTNANTVQRTYTFQDRDGTIADLEQFSASTGSSLVGHIASGSGAVATTVQAKLRRLPLNSGDYTNLATALAASATQVVIDDATGDVYLRSTLDIEDADTALSRSLDITRTTSVTGLSAASESGEQLRVTWQMDAQQTNPYSYTGSAITARVNSGVSQPVKATHHVFTANMQIYDAENIGSNKTEVTPWFAVLNARSDQTNGGINYWISDINAYGPAAGQEGFLGAAMMLGKYHSGTTDDSDHRGAMGWYVVTKPQAGGGKDEGVTGLTSYPLHAAMRIAGFSGTQATTNGTDASATEGFEYGVHIGGTDFTGAWLSTTQRSKIGTGVRAEDFTGYGIHLLNRHTDNTGNAIYVESDAGGVGIHIAPDANIPLLVGYNTSTQVSARFHSDDAGAAQGPVVQFYRDSATPAADDILGSLDWYGIDSAAAETRYANIGGIIVDPTNGSEDGALRIQALVAGVLTEAVRFSNVAYLQVPTGIGVTPDTTIPLLVKADATSQLAARFVSNDAGASAGPILQLYRDSASPANSDVLGQIDWYGKDAAGNETVYSRVYTSISDAANGSEDGTWSLSVMRAGTLTECLKLDDKATITGRLTTVTLDGGMELYKASAPFIDFKDDSAEDYDYRIQHSADGLTFSKNGGGQALYVNGGIRLDATTAATATGGAATLPANPVGFIEINIAGTTRKLPYYAS